MDRHSIMLGKTPPPPPRKEKPPKEPKKPRDSSSPGVREDSSSSEVRAAVISDLMRTTEGRSRLAAAMADPLRRRMDYSSIARRAFSVQPLPSGALPVYDVGGESYYLGEDGQQVFSTSRPRLAVPMFEIASNPQIPLSAIRERRFELIDRAQNLALQDLNGAEENGAFSILERATLNNIMQADVTPESLAELFSSIERNDLRVARLFMNPWGYADMRRRIGGSGHLDIETSRELMDVGLMGTIFGAQVIVSSAVPVGSIYATSDPEFVGVIPVRMDITALSADNPEQQTLGWSVFEEIGMACTNPRSMARLTFPTEFVEPVVEEPVIVIPRMDRYALLRSLTNDDL